MARIDIHEDTLVVTIEGWHKLLALKHKIEVPIACISGVRMRPEIPKFNDADFRGTHVPGKVVAGMSLRNADGVVFCDVEDPKRSIAIDLHDVPELSHIIIELSDMTPEEGARIIEAARHSSRHDGEHAAQ
jgi:hypothetical protein